METKEKESDSKIMYCYLISDGWRYKIGKSTNPKERVKSLKTANPHCELITFGTGRTEKQLHEIFNAFRTGGEWFRLKYKHVELIKRLLNDKETGQDLRVCASLRSAAKIEKQDMSTYMRLGKYKGKKISDMTSPEEIKYLAWIQTWPNVERDFPRMIRAINVHLSRMDEK